MLHGLFVTGTDTGIGKTVAAAALLHRYRGLGGLRYWKPIQTGIEVDDDTATVEYLAQCRPEEIRRDGIRLRQPVSPHLAAERSGVTIQVEQLGADFAACAGSNRWIVEGAGGALVPINDTERITDLIRRLQVPALVVCRASLGTINHTLLTLEALRRRSIEVAAVLMVGEPNSDNRAAIERFGNVRVVGEMPLLAPLNPETLGQWARLELDPSNHLAPYLQ